MSTKLADLTVDEFKQLIATTVEWKLMEILGDPDEGLELREEIKDRLRRSLETERRGARGISTTVNGPAEGGSGQRRPWGF